MINALDLRNVEMLRSEGLNALAERLGSVGLVNFIRLFDSGAGDYTIERRETIEQLTQTDFNNFLKDNINKPNAPHQ